MEPTNFNYDNFAEDFIKSPPSTGLLSRLPLSVAQTSFDSKNFSEAFSTSLSKTRTSIIKQLLKLTNHDVTETSKILDAWSDKTLGLIGEGIWPTEEPIKDIDFNDRHFSEYFLSLAFTIVQIIEFNSNPSDLLKALERLVLANRLLGMSESLNPSVKSKERRSFAEKSAKNTIANAARVNKYEKLKKELREYWLEKIRPSKLSTEAAILLERTDTFKNASLQLKRSTLEAYVRKWQKELKK